MMWHARGRQCNLRTLRVSALSPPAVLPSPAPSAAASLISISGATAAATAALLLPATIGSTTPAGVVMKPSAVGRAPLRALNADTTEEHASAAAAAARSRLVHGRWDATAQAPASPPSRNL